MEDDGKNEFSERTALGDLLLLVTRSQPRSAGAGCCGRLGGLERAGRKQVCGYLHDGQDHRRHIGRAADQRLGGSQGNVPQCLLVCRVAVGCRRCGTPS